jgi:two-component system nitrate/nitrite response regulator NarL
MTTSIVVADAERLFSEGLVQLLATQNDFRIVGEAADVVEAVQLAWREQPDIVLAALDLPKEGGEEAARRIRKVSPASKVIMLVPPRGAEHTPFVGEHVHGVLRASARASQIFERIRALQEAETVREVRVPFTVEEPEPGGPEPLTPREQEVLQLIAQAWSNRQIEDALGIQKSTVKRHVRRILRKLHARNRVQAAVFAYRDSHLSQEGVTKP